MHIIYYSYTTEYKYAELTELFINSYNQQTGECKCEPS